MKFYSGNIFQSTRININVISSIILLGALHHIKFTFLHLVRNYYQMKRSEFNVNIYLHVNLPKKISRNIELEWNFSATWLTIYSEHIFLEKSTLIYVKSSMAICTDQFLFTCYISYYVTEITFRNFIYFLLQFTFYLLPYPSISMK